MTKNQKMLLGVGAVAVVGYLVYKNMNKSKGFATMSSQPVFAPATGGMFGRRVSAPDCTKNPEQCPCPCKEVAGGPAADGTILCKNGHTCCGSKSGPCGTYTGTNISNQ